MMENNTGIVEIAKNIATRAHEGQYRRPNRFGVKEPYIKHPERVVNLVSQFTQDTDAIAAAWLHDVLEDTKCTEMSLKDSGIPDTVLYFVRHLTKNKEIKYDNYIEELKKCDIMVRMIKTADILDNLTDSPSNSQIEKYKKALMLLAI